jgi:hypothetical protein
MIRVSEKISDQGSDLENLSVTRKCCVACKHEEKFNIFLFCIRCSISLVIVLFLSCQTSYIFLGFYDIICSLIILKNLL